MAFRESKKYSFTVYQRTAPYCGSCNNQAAIIINGNGMVCRDFIV